MNPAVLDEICELLKHENNKTYDQMQELAAELRNTKALVENTVEKTYRLKAVIHNLLTELENI